MIHKHRQVVTTGTSLRNRQVDIGIQSVRIVDAEAFEYLSSLKRRIDLLIPRNRQSPSEFPRRSIQKADCCAVEAALTLRDLDSAMLRTCMCVERAVESVCCHS